jgi:thioredoxin reductase
MKSNVHLVIVDLSKVAVEFQCWRVSGGAGAMASGDTAGFDACVVGAGMAGLSAALMLGRARRVTLVADAGPGRNAAASAVHAMIGHDGTPPERLRALARQQVAGYPDVTVARSPVTQVAGQADAFEIGLADGQCYRTRRVLLATGIADELPPIEGLRPLWGRTVVHCPYCHGWELRGQPLAFLILRPADVFLGLKLTHLSSDVVGLLNGAPDPPPAEQAMLREAGITLRAEPIARLARDGDRLRQVIFTDSRCLDRAGLFVHPPARQAAPFAASLGCDMLPDGVVAVDDLGRTSVPGVYAAGDMGRRPAMPLPGQLAAVAAAAGTLAAVAVDHELLLADTGVPVGVGRLDGGGRGGAGAGTTAR